MDPLIQKELEKEVPTQFHEKLLAHCKELVKLSRDHMTQFYDKWDQHDDVYRGIKQSDESDKKAENRGEPQKMVVPLTYAQIQTFIAFCFSTFYQRERLFEIEGMGPEDSKPAKVGEALLERDLTYNTMELKMHQFLLDVARFGLAPIKTCWIEEHQMVEETTQEAKTFLGFNFGTKEVTQKVWQTKYAGNEIENISPYRFFPDPRVPFSKIQKGEFVASEDSVSYVTLRQMEADGAVAGISFVKTMRQDDFEKSSRRMAHTTLLASTGGATTIGEKKSGSHVLTEVQVKLVPSDFEVDGKPMGEETYPVIYNVWIVNDCRVVKCEPLGYAHGMFTYDVGECNPDMHNLINEGLAGVIDQLQSVISWLINSHITSVRKNIDNKFVVDPSGIDMADLKERRPVIRLKPEAQNRGGVDRYIKQLAVSDVTKGHIADANELQAVVQIVTGINDNALGQFNTGRRSATEARNVNGATAARLKTLAMLLWKQAIEPMGRKMLSNLRDGLDYETYVKVLGLEADPNNFVQFSKVSKKDLVGDYDFAVFDGTLPSERRDQAETLQELVLALFTSPQAIAVLGYDPRKLVDEILELKGIRNPVRFKLDQLRMEEMQAQSALLGGTINGQSDGQGGVGGQPTVPGQASGIPMVNGNGAGRY